MNAANSSASNIALSASTFNENISANSTIATLSSSDPDAGDTFVYSFVSGDGDTDNSAFTISGNELKINASPDFETKNSYSIRLQSEDSGGLTYQKGFTLNVANVKETPSTL